ncbi:MAG TPA: hypothetical protein PLW49_02270 [bacterium]|jgi:hypothetical protein|nr:hypothetical protein [bacterium]
MNKKVKILVGILVVVILVTSGWWIWKNQTVKGLDFESNGTCGLKASGSNYDISYCDRSCNLDIDCQFTCGCGAVNKNEICHDEGIIYDCVERYVKCEEKKCVALEEKSSK